jgi:hypothetical protein
MYGRDVRGLATSSWWSLDLLEEETVARGGLLRKSEAEDQAHIILLSNTRTDFSDEPRLLGMEVYGSCRKASDASLAVRCQEAVISTIRAGYDVPIDSVGKSYCSTVPKRCSMNIARHLASMYHQTYL